MTKPVLLITRKLRDSVEARAAETYDVRLNPTDRLMSPRELIDACRAVDAVLPCHSERFDADVIAAIGPRLKIIANHSVGTDHVDLAAAKAAGIVVTNTPDVLSDATAEIAILCMLGASRRGAEGDAMIRAGKWDFWSPAFMVGRQVTGKRFGVLGMGRVGQVTADRARGFGMEIHYHNRSRLPDHLEKGGDFSSHSRKFVGGVRCLFAALSKYPRYSRDHQCAQPCFVAKSSDFNQHSAGRFGGRSSFDRGPAIGATFCGRFGCLSSRTGRKSCPCRLAKRVFAAPYRVGHRRDARCDGLSGLGQFRRVFRGKTPT